MLKKRGHKLLKKTPNKHLVIEKKHTLGKFEKRKETKLKLCKVN